MRPAILIFLGFCAFFSALAEPVRLVRSGMAVMGLYRRTRSCELENAYSVYTNELWVESACEFCCVSPADIVVG